MVVVTDPQLMQCRAPRRLDPPDDPRIDKSGEHAVDGLRRGRAELLPNVFDDALGIRVRTLPKRPEHTETGRGNPQSRSPDQRREVSIRV